MDYQKLKYFLKAAQTLNFSEAARQMYITPQSFGKQISLLEQEMGFLLFERNTRQIKLTSSGRMVYESLFSRLQDLEKEYERLCILGNKRSRQVRIGVFNALSRTKVVSPIINSILAKYPDRDINIRMCDMSTLKTDMQNGHLDLCITATHEAEPQWIGAGRVSLHKSPACIVVSKYHPWFIKDNITEEDMKENNYIKMKMPFALSSNIFETVPCKTRTEVDNYETMCVLLDQGDYFTIMSSEFDTYCENGAKKIPLNWSPFDFELSIVYNKDNSHGFLPEFCSFIQEVFEV